MDKEINIGCLDEDLTQKIVDKIHTDNNYFLVIEDGLRKNTLIFFSPSTHDGYENQWDIVPGVTLLVPFFKSGDKRVEYMGEGHSLIWPAYHLDKLSTVKYKGHKLNVPYDYKGWLKHYFGDDWGEENLDWHWSQANNLCQWKGGDKFEK